MIERVSDAVRRLGNHWSSSKELRGHWLNLQEERRVQRPDLMDALIMRMRMRQP